MSINNLVISILFSVRPSTIHQLFSSYFLTSLQLAMAGAGDVNMDMDMETESQIQNELRSIDALVCKIKQELLVINGFVRTEGSLDLALKNATDSLTSMAQEILGQVPEPNPSTDEQNPTADRLSRITTKYITEKLEALSHE